MERVHRFRLHLTFTLRSGLKEHMSLTQALADAMRKREEARYGVGRYGYGKSRSIPARAHPSLVERIYTNLLLRHAVSYELLRKEIGPDITDRQLRRALEICVEDGLITVNPTNHRYILKK